MKKGFSLLELLIIIAIVLIIATIALPNFIAIHHGVQHTMEGR